jgi:hypothetical protein
MRKVALIVTAVVTFSCVGATSAGATSSHQRSEYLSQIHREAPSLNHASLDGAEVKLGQNVCSLISVGDTFHDLEKMAKSSSLGYRTYLVIISGAVNHLC